MEPSDLRVVVKASEQAFDEQDIRLDQGENIIRWSGQLELNCVQDFDLCAREITFTQLIARILQQRVASKGDRLHVLAENRDRGQNVQLERLLGDHLVFTQVSWFVILHKSDTNESLE